MAIKISNLQQISDQYQQRQYLFTDLHLDFAVASNFSSGANSDVKGNDVKIDYDENAIRNSLRNLFNTRPGQRFLFPKYGLDLNQYLFEGVNERHGQIIGEKIVTSIGYFEPRVTVTSCNVIAMPDDNQYDITVIVNIPIFSTAMSLNSHLDVKNQTFIFVETSRNR